MGWSAATVTEDSRAPVSLPSFLVLYPSLMIMIVVILIAGVVISIGSMECAP